MLRTFEANATVVRQRTGRYAEPIGRGATHQDRWDASSEHAVTAAIGALTTLKVELSFAAD